MTWTEAPVEPDLANVHAQSCSPSVGRRPVHGAHVDLQDAARAGVHRSWSARAGARQHDGQPDGRLGLATGHRGHTWGQKPRHLLRDRDAVYGRDFRQRARRIGIDAIATPIHAPKTNTIAERVIGTLRRECLDHLIILDEHPLLSVLCEFVAYYNQERPHRTLGLQTPEPRHRAAIGPIRSRPVLNGLHHVYERAA
ncbi:MAG: hypothetical protein E6I75_03690 [Chloroflexi bacterium]|nr:MAG: hypothetical protein E6I75_03690 [Chloroflexota bacterium]